MKRALLTGFEPFGPYSFNPTEVVREYNEQTVAGAEIHSLILPSTYYGAFDVLSHELAEWSPDIILSTGFASRVQRLRFEAVGRNVMNGKYPDAEGQQPKNEPIIQNGKSQYPTNTDCLLLANALYASGIPAEISVDAEGFICNSFLYLTARKIHEEGLPIRHAFFHTPWTEDYLAWIQLEPGKIAIKKEDLRKSIEVLLECMGQDS